jgi:hypothetical protein
VRRGLVALALLAPAAAHADGVLPDIGDREISAVVGAASGSRTTPGGFRVGGRFLYQLSDQDWFDGAVAFTFGSGTAACFRDRSDTFVCDHGLADGFSGELGAGIRRFFAGNGGFRPYARLGVAARVIRFGADDVTGFAIPIEAGGGVRVRVADDVAVGGEASLEIGPGWLGHGLGAQLERGFAIGALVEIRLP